MDFRKIVSTYAPLVPAIAVAAAVMIGLSGYETPTYAVTEHPAESLTEEPAQKIPVSQEKEETEEIGTGAFDVPDGTYTGSAMGFLGVYGNMSGTSPWDVFSMLRALNFRFEKYAVGIVLLALILVGMALEERFFCKFFCPMGAIFSLMPVLTPFSLRRNRPAFKNRP